MLSKKYSLLVLLIMTLVFFFSACESVEHKKEDTIFFNQDLELLSAPDSINDAKIVIAPPKNWKIPDSSLISTISSKLDQVRDSSINYRYSLLKIFLDSTSSSILSVGLIEQNQSKASVAVNKTEYVSMVEKSFLSKNVKRGFFVKDNIEIVQFLIQEVDFITFKLIFLNHRNNIVQIDYILNSKKYLDLISF